MENVSLAPLSSPLGWLRDDSDGESANVAPVTEQRAAWQRLLLESDSPTWEALWLDTGGEG